MRSPHMLVGAATNATPTNTGTSQASNTGQNPASTATSAVTADQSTAEYEIVASVAAAIVGAIGVGGMVFSKGPASGTAKGVAAVGFAAASLLAYFGVQGFQNASASATTPTSGGATSTSGFVNRASAFRAHRSSIHSVNSNIRVIR
jgi:hypothetical protein